MPGQETVFICYRREDSTAQADALTAALTPLFGAETVFFDTDSITLGAPFPARIASALTRASAVLVVIGPRWLAILKERMKLPDLDPVRREVSTALQPRPGSALPLVIPVLWGGAKMPKADELPADLAALHVCNADFKSLAGTAPDVAQLQLRLLMDAGVHRDNPEVTEKAFHDLGKAIEKLLAEPPMKAIADKWDQLPSALSAATNMLDAISGFAQAIKDSQPWRTQMKPKELELVQRTCMKVLTQLFHMTVGFAYVHQWADGNMRHPFPANSAGLAINLAAVSQGLGVELELEDRGMKHAPKFANALDAQITDSGIGSDELIRLEQEFWSATASSDLLGIYPGDYKTPLAGDNRTELLASIAEAKRRKRPLLLTSRQAPNAPVLEDLRQFAAGYGVVLVAFSPQPHCPLRFPLIEVYASMRVCMANIHSISDLSPSP